MRRTLCLASLIGIFMTACNSVKFSPEEVQQPSVPPPPLQCVEGETAWVPGGQGQQQCPNACSDGSFLQCVTNLEKELVCNGNGMVETGNTRVASVGSPIGSCPLPPTTKTVIDEFNAPPPGKADILVILDTTMSMSPDLNKLSARFTSLTKHLGDVDWQVAVTNAGASDGWLGSWDAHGQFFQFQDHPQGKKILKKSDPYVDHYFQLTVGSKDDEVRYEGQYPANVCNYQPYCTHSHPEPLKALTKAIDLRATKNAGFFRKDAWLVPLMISDAEEDEYGGAAATQPKAVVEHFEKTLGKTMKGVLGFGIVIKPGDHTCRDSHDSLFSRGKFGEFVQKFADMTGGLTMSICETDYSKGLGQISERVRDRMTSIELSEEPVSNDVVVTVTPEVPGLTWKRVGKKILFSKALPANAKVRVVYQAKAK